LTLYSAIFATLFADYAFRAPLMLMPRHLRRRCFDAADAAPPPLQPPLHYFAASAALRFRHLFSPRLPLIAPVITPPFSLITLIRRHFQLMITLMPPLLMPSSLRHEIFSLSSPAFSPLH
jgi:hypothetical protein